MLKIPQTERTISQLVESQFPSFVAEDYPMFILFLRAYYEWLEKDGIEVFSCKIVSSTQSTVVLTSTASTKTNAYQGMTLVALNGPLKGSSKKISSYDPETFTVAIESPWDYSQTPPANTKMSIRESVYPGRLTEYRDIDLTLDRFIQFFKYEFMYQIPGNILADPRLIIKHLKEFYQARGTEASFRFLFRILFNEDVEFYYPKVDVFRTSDARWYVQNVMRTTTTGNTFDYATRQLIGVASGATARVESAVQQYVNNISSPTVTHQLVTTLTLSNIDGDFGIDPATGLPEQVKIVYPVSTPPQSELGSMTDLLEPYTETVWEQTYELLKSLTIQSAGNNYVVGDLLDISGGGGLSPAQAVVTNIFQTYYSGGCSPPPSTYYLEPYFGPNDTVNPTENSLLDAVCIPGLYFFSDVQSPYTSSDLLNANEIVLSQNETTIDNFFVGDEITLTGGTGFGQKRTIVSYNGTTKVATVDVSFDIIPDSSTQYTITHIRGGIKSVSILDFGLGFVTTPTVTIQSVAGNGAVLIPVLGLVGTTSGAWLSGRDGGIGGFPTTTDSFLNSNKVLQDSYYWQDFSYDLRVGLTIDKYRDAVKTLLHPAGLMMFGTLLLKSQPKTDFLKTVETLIIKFDLQKFDETITLYNDYTLQIGTRQDAQQVVGAKNKDLDWMKFFAFMPNSLNTLNYPYPNENYFTPTGPGNTQINNFKDIVIGTIIDFPNRRTKINADSYINIKNSESLTLVGPIGQTRGTVARFKFTGFPPFEGFNIQYPSPNEHYWDYFGNTQISTFKDVVIDEMITSPKTKRANNCVDSDIAIYRQENIPTIGDLCEYSFVPGMDSQIVYDVGPNLNGFDATLGSDIFTDANDPTWVDGGVQFDSSNGDIINASGIPLSLEQCTVVLVAMTPDVSADASIISSIATSTDSGFSIDLRSSGGISFRAQYGGISKYITFPDSTITSGEYFMAALRFDDNVLSGTVNQLPTLSAKFSSFPAVPVISSAGWYFGGSSTDYIPLGNPASLFDATRFGTNMFTQASTTGTNISIGHFNGVLAYAIFYDRAIYQFELDFIYTQLQTNLLQERGIMLP